MLKSFSPISLEGIENMTFEYSASDNALKFDSPRAAMLLRSILIAGKFNEGLDAKLLFNQQLNDLIKMLPEWPSDPAVTLPEGSYDEHFLEKVAYGIAYEHKVRRLDWPAMSQNEQAEFIEHRALYPNRITSTDLKKVVDLVNKRVTGE